MLKKLVKLFAVLGFVLISSFTYTQTFDYEKEYTILSGEYDTLLADYSILNNKYDALNNTYSKEISMHELSKEQIKFDQIEITMLRDDITDLIKLVDPEYFTLFIIGGYQGINPLGELAISASIPKLPFAVYGGIEYIYLTGMNMKLGIGVKF